MARDAQKGPRVFAGIASCLTNTIREYIRKSEKPAKQSNGHSDIFTIVDQAKARGVPQGAIRVM